MHILITDSGVGGLSVCAYAERLLRHHDPEEPVRLTYVNASPENDFGYNSMGSRKEKSEYFDRFLRIVYDRYSPDSIYIACNTLSVLMKDTPFVRNGEAPVRGIVETGVNLVLRDLARFPESAVVIFGTVTTIEEQAYPDSLIEAGISEARIISHACPGLADTISEDRRGLKAASEIGQHVRAAIEKLDPSTSSCLVYLACTHYGYRKELFMAAFADAGFQAEILNPNEYATDELFASLGVDLRDDGRDKRVDVEVVSRYRIPETALETLTYFLEGISLPTVHALRNFTHLPDLF